MNEKRHFYRIAFDSTTYIISDGVSLKTHLIDISLKGLLTEKPVGFSANVGDHVAVEIHLSGSSVLIAMQTKVAHIENDRIGFVCVKIDLDSVTHLKRLVELNLPESNLLERELSELVTYGR